MKRLAFAALLVAALPATAQVSVQDDSGRNITLPTPARRIVSLAPHATELLFAVGAGARLVGVIDYSDYPPAARQLPSVGGAATFDVERIATLQPDLVVAWGSGNSPAKIARLRSLGIPVFESEPRDFAAIGSSLERLARLAGTDAAGQAAALAFEKRRQALAAKYAHRAPVRVFYQVWRTPLMTLNGAHLVSQALALCGGQNIFAGLPQLAPTVGLEAVLQANPEAIIAGSGEAEALDDWRRWPRLAAVARGNLFTIPSDTMTRPGPRVLDATETLCRQLESVRGKRK
jgi:iron complex transport system substrate-binding protein